MIDADAHVEESVASWQYLAAAYRARRPLPVALPDDTSWGDFNGVWLIDGQVRQAGATPTTMGNAQQKRISVGSQELTDVAARLADLDRAGIDVQVIYPTVWLACLAEDPDLEAELARSYNQFMAEQCGRSGGRLYYAAVVPFRRPAAAVAEIRRVRELGSVVGVFARGVEWDMPLSHPSFGPIYAEAERQRLAMAVHIGFGSPTINRLFEGLPRLPGSHPFLKLPFVPPRGFELSCILHAPFAFASICGAGLLDEFPDLRWVFLEAGAEWFVPAARALTRAGQPHPRRHFAAGRIYAGCEPDEDLPYLVSQLGEDWLVACSDMPHSDLFVVDRPEEAFRARGDLSERVLDKLLRANAQRLYSLE